MTLKLPVTILFALLSVASASDAARADGDDGDWLKPQVRAVIDELNLARTQPRAYADFLREYATRVQGNRLIRPGRPYLVLKEGRRAVDEAVRFLERVAPKEPLRPSKGLCAAAADLAREQGRTGATGHRGADGSTPASRVEAHGQWLECLGENVCYGPSTAREIVIDLIIDDGVRSRSHRATIFHDGFTLVGAALGPHPKFGTVCVQEFAGGFDPS